MAVRVLRPIWLKKAETASRVRGRIEAILDAAKALDKRSGENPARWRRHLDKILPKRDRVRRVKHHPALPYSEIPTFVAELAARPAPAARVLHLLILTCVRRSEALLARPEEFDLERRVSTVPADRMKMEKGLRVPLSAAAVRLVREAMKTAAHGYLFSRATEGQATVEYGDAQYARASGAWRHNRAWIPIDVSRLGRRVYRVPGFARRDGARTCGREQGGRRLSSRRYA